jgi:hypothetical protein
MLLSMWAQQPERRRLHRRLKLSLVVAVAVATFLSMAFSPVQAWQRQAASERIEIAAYYFPGYHADPLWEKDNGAGWTHWNLIEKATPRFRGHTQPKIPVWGFEDESDPQVFEKKIDAAADHGLDAFIFDWYWSGNRSVLAGALEHGYLHATNNKRLKFAIMWANHNPFGPVTRAEWDEATDYILANYLTHPSYWTIDGRPYFSIYEPVTLLRSLGSVEATRAAFDSLREKAKSAGLPGIHLNLIDRDNDLSMATQLGADSVTDYTWFHMLRLRDFPVTQYGPLISLAVDYWEKAAKTYAPLSFFPNVTMGWDPSPMTDPNRTFEQREYPFTATIGDNTPREFEKALNEARKFVEKGGRQPKIVIISAWNEWSEGSYLEPDTVHQLGYLQAIRKVFDR